MQTLGLYGWKRRVLMTNFQFPGSERVDLVHLKDTVTRASNRIEVIACLYRSSSNYLWDLGAQWPDWRVKLDQRTSAKYPMGRETAWIPSQHHTCHLRLDYTRVFVQANNIEWELRLPKGWLYYLIDYRGHQIVCRRGR